MSTMETMAKYKRQAFVINLSVITSDDVCVKLHSHVSNFNAIANLKATIIVCLTTTNTTKTSGSLRYKPLRWQY
jgi:hypothetical protein